MFQHTLVLIQRHVVRLLGDITKDLKSWHFLKVETKFSFNSIPFNTLDQVLSLSNKFLHIVKYIKLLHDIDLESTLQ